MRGQRKINSPTQSRFKQNTDASPLQGQILKAVADAGGLPSPDSKQRKKRAGEPNKCSRRKSTRKHVLPQDAGRATELKRLQTPINLFEDECVFCHSFRNNELFHGPVVRYLKGRILSVDESNSSNAIYVHKKCLEWAPKVWYDGGIVMNLESEIRRASRLKCRRCGLLGAALGCYEKHCRKSYHVPCALQTDCRWDFAKGHILCPEHVSKTLPCDKLRTHRKENYSSSQRQSKCADKEGNLYVRHRETEQTDQLNTSNASLFPQSQPFHKEGISPNSSRGGKQMDQLNSMSSCFPGSLDTKKEEKFGNHQRKKQQTYELNISNPSYLPRSQHSQKEGISTNNLRDGQIDQLDTSRSSSLPLGQHSYDKATSKNRERNNRRTHECNASNLSQPQSHFSSHPDKGISNVFQGEETTADHPDTSSCPSDLLVLFGLSLSVSEKDFLQNFACSTNATLDEEWSKDVTHVIVAKGAVSSCRRSFEVLMAILFGRWVVHFEWVVACLGTLPSPEAAYEVAFSMDSVRTIDGPKKGRMRAAEGGPNLFSGLCFCLSDYMNPDNRDRMRDLIATAEGRVLERRDLHLLQLKNPDESSVKLYFVYDSGESSLSTLHKEMEEASEQVAAGARLICHLRVLDAIAAYDADILNVNRRFTS